MDSRQDTLNQDDTLDITKFTYYTIYMNCGSIRKQSSWQLSHELVAQISM